MKKFLDFIRLEAVSPSRVKKKKWKKINFSMPRGALGATSFYLRDGLRRKGGTTHSKKFLAIIWPYLVSPTQRKNKIEILRQPQRSPSFLLIWNQTEQNMVYWYLKKPITILLQQENEILLFYLSRSKNLSLNHLVYSYFATKRVFRLLKWIWAHGTCSGSCVLDCWRYWSSLEIL